MQTAVNNMPGDPIIFQVVYAYFQTFCRIAAGIVCKNSSKKVPMVVLNLSCDWLLVLKEVKI